ncbi:MULTISPECIES: flagellar motor switch protein FliG [Henriciella]|jgi:flagellar motor switch protein FliG|uniref:flagellar motor switch protein FliG n=1 Tax=Henriciella TaxID=453849 RepID=UPI0035195370
MSVPALVQDHRSVFGRGVARAARLMKALGPAASGVWAELSPEEADQLSVAMNTPHPHSSATSPSDDTADFVRSYEAAPAPEPGSAESSIWARLSQMDPAQIARGFETENPQVIAVILSRLAPDAAAATVRALPRPVATDALQRLLHLGRIRTEALSVIEQAVGDLVASGLDAATGNGHETVARIFDEMGGQDENGLLAALDKNEPGSGQRIRALMFTFDDLSRLEPAAIQTILSSVDRAVLGIALKGARPAVREAFLRNMTKRAGDLLVTEIESLGPVRRSEIGEARQDIIRMARSLARRGDILSANDDDELVE